MPNIGIHLLVAQRVLDRWSGAGSDPPFPLSDREAVSAFMHGAILPDAGYFPRGDRLFSELVHLTRTADLVRAQLHASTSPSQLAHAWGWATHVLADLAIHPLINQAHGELLGDRTRPVTSMLDEVGHMRLEFGLDAAAFRAFAELASLDPGKLPNAEAVAPVYRAFERVYAWRLAPRSILAAVGVAGRMARLNRWINRARSAGFPRDPLFGMVRLGAKAVAPPRRWMPGRWNRSSAVLGVLAPIEPPAWLFEAVTEQVESVAMQLDDQRDSRLAELDNHDLTTGMPESEAIPTARAKAALAMLKARRERGLTGAVGTAPA